jgi:hypothetical protein
MSQVDLPCSAAMTAEFDSLPVRINLTKCDSPTLNTKTTLAYTVVLDIERMSLIDGIPILSYRNSRVIATRKVRG